ncbi:hypothetical protein VTK73DRAFT_7340 [Phialemonium thermophilum]|uniref:DUF2293 domain-containing protein n=1 Tax=Phialemonium thermophilum TaxID=223376 RepID=A0ABR3XTM7_9PEZI
MIPPKSKHHTYFEFVENKDKKKKLEFQVTTQRDPPPGFEFVPIGNPALTTACKELSREQDAMIFIVSTAKDAEAKELTLALNRVGHHVRQTIVEQARASLGDHEFIQTTTDLGVPEPIPETQEEINKQADAAIRDLFPRIPNIDRQAIIEHAFKKGATMNGLPLVGLAPDITLSRRVQLAVLAHIRHTHTRYDQLLRETSYVNARKAVESLCLDILVKWRGDEETGRDQLDEILREVVVISDSEDENDDSTEDDETSEATDDSSVQEIEHPETLHSPTPNGYAGGAFRVSDGLANAKMRPDRATPVPPHRQFNRVTKADRKAEKKAHRGFLRYQAVRDQVWHEAVQRQRLALPDSAPSTLDMLPDPTEPSFYNTGLPQRDALQRSSRVSHTADPRSARPDMGPPSLSYDRQYLRHFNNDPDEVRRTDGSEYIRVSRPALQDSQLALHIEASRRNDDVSESLIPSIEPQCPGGHAIRGVPLTPYRTQNPVVPSIGLTSAKPAPTSSSIRSHLRYGHPPPTDVRGYDGLVSARDLREMSTSRDATYRYHFNGPRNESIPNSTGRLAGPPDHNYYHASRVYPQHRNQAYYVPSSGQEPHPSVIQRASESRPVFYRNWGTPATIKEQRSVAGWEETPASQPYDNIRSDPWPRAPEPEIIQIRRVSADHPVQAHQLSRSSFQDGQIPRSESFDGLRAPFIPVSNVFPPRHDPRAVGDDTLAVVGRDPTYTQRPLRPTNIARHQVRPQQVSWPTTYTAATEAYTPREDTSERIRLVDTSQVENEAPSRPGSFTDTRRPRAPFYGPL